MINDVRVLIAGEEIIPCDIGGLTFRNHQGKGGSLKPFNFFRPDLDLSVYRELCGIVFKLGYKDPLAKSFMEKHGYLCDEAQLQHLEQLLDYQLMQDLDQ